MRRTAFVSALLLVAPALVAVPGLAINYGQTEARGIPTRA